MTDLGVHDPLKIPLHRDCVYIRAIVEGHARTQLEGIGLQIVRDIPFRCYTRCRLHVRGQIQQPLGRGRQGVGDVVGQVLVRIQAAGIGAGGKTQDAAAFGRRLRCFRQTGNRCCSNRRPDRRSASF